MLPELLPILAGAAFTLLVIWAAGRLVAPGTALPAELRFLCGAPLVSLAVFIALQLHAAAPVILVGVGLALASRSLIRGCAPGPALPCPEQPYNLLFHAIWIGFSLGYFIYALAPEIEPDAVGYHLGLVSEYARTRTMPARVSFYDLLPQGMEMLFLPAFVVGRFSAAKLVHFAFLVLSVPLLRRLGAAVGLGAAPSAAGALLFFLAPVTAVDGTSAYTDVALVCVSVGSLVLLIQWTAERTTGLLVAAGLVGGFCYAIKPTMGLIPVAGAIWVAVRSRSLRATCAFALPAAVSIVPWAGRAFVITGNPFAPFLNRWFPNSGIPVSTEQMLNTFFGLFSPNFQWKTAYADYTVWGGHQGMLGAAFLLIPLALLSLRRRPGRVLLGLSSLLLLTFPANTGTRFLMPAAGPAALALAAALPTPAAFALAAVQGAASLRPAMLLYNIRNDWKLPPFPPEAALRIQPEAAYLNEHLWDYPTSRMIRTRMPENAKFYALGNYLWAYTEREHLDYWHSTYATKVWSDLIVVQVSATKPAVTATWTWPAGAYSKVRLWATAELRVPQARAIPGSQQQLPWDPLTEARPLVVDLTPDSTGFEAVLWPANAFGVKLEGRTADGSWALVATPPSTVPAALGLRRQSMQNLLKSGYEYILAPVDHSPFAEIGREMRDHSDDWGLEKMGHERDAYLFRIRP